MNFIVPQDPKTYNVKKVPLNQVEITGTGKSDAWQKANTLTDFCYPWNNATPPITTFKAVWDGEHLFFNFCVEDPNIVTNYSAIEENAQIMESDRVELFFKSDSKLSEPYYCLEMDSAARLLSSKSSYYRQHEFSWKWPGVNPLNIKSSLTKGGYIVEGAISIEALNSLNLIQNSSIQTGVFRANFVQANNVLEPKWISWVIPKSEKPDFHIPSSFGLFKLSD